MGYENLFVANQDGHNLCLYKWTPKDKNNAAGIVQIAHGMAEWAGRYNYFAEKLTEAGYIVYAHDHRGHGKTAKDAENIGFLGEDGFNGMVRDLRLVHNLINEKHPRSASHSIWTQHGFVSGSELYMPIWQHT